MAAISAAVFDLDGTLHDRGPSLVKFATTVHQRYAMTQPLDDWLAHFMAIDNNGYRVATPDFLTQVLTDFDVAAKPAEVVELFQSSVWSAPTLYDDALSTLVTVREMGLSIALLTNGSAQSQTQKINNTGLADFVDTIVISGELGFKKPDPRIFAYVCDQLRLAPDECVMVGDSAVNDVVAARDFGMATVWVARGDWPAGADRSACSLTVSRPSEMLDWLRGQIH